MHTYYKCIHAFLISLMWLSIIWKISCGEGIRPVSNLDHTGTSASNLLHPQIFQTTQLTEHNYNNCINFDRLHHIINKTSTSPTDYKTSPCSNFGGTHSDRNHRHHQMKILQWHTVKVAQLTHRDCAMHARPFQTIFSLKLIGKLVIISY